METSIIISGFGGQGTLFAGQVLTYAAMDEGHHVTWIPSYGPEMRGGTAHCTVIVSDEEIGSPLVSKPDIVIALNLPSFDKYENIIKEGGTMVANKSMITKEFTRKGITGVFIPGNDIAEELGNSRITNMVLLGAMLELAPVVSMEAAKKALEEHIAERHKKTIPMNFEAMEKGAQVAREAVAEKA